MTERTSSPDKGAERLTSRRAAAPGELDDGFIPAGTVVTDLAALERLLSTWIDSSARPTISEVGRFGGSAAIIVKIPSEEFVLNRDTKRVAVETFLEVAKRAGGAAKLPWHVTANRTGKLNRVSYRPDDAPTPGWYAYLRVPRTEPGGLP